MKIEQVKEFTKIAQWAKDYLQNVNVPDSASKELEQLNLKAQEMFTAIPYISFGYDYTTFNDDERLWDKLDAFRTASMNLLMKLHPNGVPDVFADSLPKNVLNQYEVTYSEAGTRLPAKDEKPITADQYVNIVFTSFQRTGKETNMYLSGLWFEEIVKNYKERLKAKEAEKSKAEQEHKDNAHQSSPYIYDSSTALKNDSQPAAEENEVEVKDAQPSDKEKQLQEKDNPAPEKNTFEKHNPKKKAAPVPEANELEESKQPAAEEKKAEVNVEPKAEEKKAEVKEQPAPEKEESEEKISFEERRPLAASVPKGNDEKAYYAAVGQKYIDKMDAVLEKYKNISKVKEFKKYLDLYKDYVAYSDSEENLEVDLKYYIFKPLRDMTNNIADDLNWFNPFKQLGLSKITIASEVIDSYKDKRHLLNDIYYAFDDKEIEDAVDDAITESGLDSREEAQINALANRLLSSVNPNVNKSLFENYRLLTNIAQKQELLDYNLLFQKMAENREFCEIMIADAYEQLEKYKDADKLIDDYIDAETAEYQLQGFANTIAVGERLLYEMSLDNSNYFKNPEIEDNLTGRKVDFNIGNFAARATPTKNDITESAVNDRKKSNLKINPINDEEAQAFNDMTAAVSEVVKYKLPDNDETGRKRVASMASQILADLSKENLHPGEGKESKLYDNICLAGTEETKRKKAEVEKQKAFDEKYPFAKNIEKSGTDEDYYIEIGRTYHNLIAEVSQSFERNLKFYDFEDKEKIENGIRGLNGNLNAFYKFSHFCDTEENLNHHITEDINNTFNDVADIFTKYIGGKSIAKDGELSKTYVLLKTFLNDVRYATGNKEISDSIDSAIIRNKVDAAETGAEQVIISSICNNYNSPKDAAKFLDDLWTLTNAREKMFKTDLIYDRMAENKEFCELVLDRSRKELEKYNNIKNVNNAAFEKQKLIGIAQTIAVGERFLNDMFLSNYSSNEKNPEALRDFAKPGIVFSKEYNASEEDKAKAIQNITHSVIDLVRSELKLEKYNNTAKIASEISDKLSTESLRPEKGKSSKLYTDICFAGNDQTLKITNTEFKTLASTGSAEFTEMHNAYAAYLEASRNPGRECENEIRRVADASEQYLNMKDTTPATTAGKERVAAAAKIFTKAIMADFGKDQAADNELADRLRSQMVRNPIVRKLVVDEIAKKSDIYEKNNAAVDVLNFAVICKELAKSDDNYKNGILCPGIALKKSDTGNILSKRVETVVNRVKERVPDYEEGKKKLFKITMKNYFEQERKDKDKVIKNNLIKNANKDIPVKGI